MADRPAVKTPSVTRPELEAIFKTPSVVRAFEALLRDVAQVLPDAAEQMGADVDAAQAAADAAQVTADAAETAASSAQASANAAQTDVDALSDAPFVVAAADPAAPNAREIAPGAGIAITDGGPGGALTVSLDRAVATLPADVTDSTGVFIDATGLSIALLANSTYLLESALTFQSAATTTGMALAITLPAGATIRGSYSHNVSATAIEGSYNIASGTVKGDTSGVLVINEDVPITGRWLITTAATAGNAQMQIRTGVAASAITLKAGSTVISTRLM